MAITHRERIPIDTLKECEFPHENSEYANFYVFIGTDYACFACVEHAKYKCDNCDEPLTNDNVRHIVDKINPKYFSDHLCKACDMADDYAGLAD